MEIIRKGERFYMSFAPEIKTKRLILRKFTAEDKEALFEILSDIEVNRFLPWFPLRSLSEAEEFLEREYLSFYAGSVEGYKYAVCDIESSAPIGYLNLSGEESRDLGYGLKKEFWNKGIITEAATAAIELFRSEGVGYITATHDINNPASGRVMQKIGMKYMYSYEELWEPKGYPVTFRMYQLNLNAEPDWVYMGYWNTRPKHFIEENV